MVFVDRAFYIIRTQTCEAPCLPRHSSLEREVYQTESKARCYLWPSHLLPPTAQHALLEPIRAEPITNKQMTPQILFIWYQGVSVPLMKKMCGYC